MTLRIGRVDFLNRLIAVGAAVALLACKPSSKAAAASAPGPEERIALPAARVVVVFPNASLAEVPPDRMLEVVRSEHVVRPDIRFLGAIAEARRVALGKVGGELRVTYRDRRWSMTLEGEEVGSLTDTASFGEALDLLRGWSKRMLSTDPKLSGPVADSPEGLLRRAGVEDAFSSQILPAVQKLDASWKKGSRSPETLDLAGRGLLTLCIQSLDRIGVADPLYAKTLAVLALREAAQGRTLVEEEALLASLMGYTTDAETLADSLPESSPARLWTGRDTKRFRSEAERAGTSRQLRYLFLLRLAAESRIGEWGAWLEANCPELKGGLPLARAALESNDFGPDLANALAMLDVLALQMTDEPRAAAVWDGMLQALADQPTGRDVLTLLRPFLPSGPVPAPGLLEKFESALAAKTRGVGALMDADTERAYYRSLFYSALYTLGVFELDRRGSTPDALAFAASLQGGPPGPAADFAKWYGDLARVRDDTRTVDALIADLDALYALGQPAIQRVGDEVLRIVPANDPRNAAAAVRYARRLEARPPSRLRFGVICLNQYLDLPCYERYYGSAARAWGRRWSETFLGYFRHASGRDALAAMAGDASVKPSARLLVLEFLANEKGADKRDLTSQVLRIVEENPQDAAVVDDAFRFLRDHGQLAQAEELERRDLRNHPEAPTLQKAQRASRLAEVLLLQGRSEEAWKTIEPWLYTGKSDVYYPASLALDALGKHAEARTMALERLARYPDEKFARAELAELLWRQDRASEVPALFQDPRHAPAPFDWRNAIGPSFRNAFAGRPAADMEAAFAPLIAGGFNPWSLAEIALVMDEAKRPDAAFALLTALTARQPWIGAIDPRFNAYRSLKAWKGEAAAVEWVRANATPPMRFKALEATLDEGLLDLFWKLEDPPEGPQGAGHVMLLRAVAFALSPAREPDRRDSLLAYFEAHRGSPQSDYGLFLLGVIPQEELLKLAADGARRGAVAYYVGIKAIGSQQYEEAADWLLIAKQTASPSSKEYQSANGILFRWARDGSSFERMKQAPLF